MEQFPPDVERSIADAVAYDKAHPSDYIVRAAYSPEKDAIDLEFATGLYVRIPRALLPRLKRPDITPAILAKIRIEGPGTAVVWDDIDDGYHLDHLWDVISDEEKRMRILADEAAPSRLRA